MCCDIYVVVVVVVLGGIYFKKIIIIIKMASVFKLPDVNVNVSVCVWWGRGGTK